MSYPQIHIQSTPNNSPNFKGNRKKFELRKSDKRKQETNSLYRTVNVTFTLVEMLSENERYFYFINVTLNVTKYSPNMFRTPVHCFFPT